MRTENIKAARGIIPLDILIRNIQLVNVLTSEVYPAEIGISNGMIVSVEQPSSGESLKALQVYDGNGKYAVPGLIDTHVHIESSMMTPAGFSKAVLPLGTTTIVTDPHEIGNVMGLRGIRYMLEATKNLPLRVYFQVPSSVPSVTGVETAGAVFGSTEVSEMLGWDRVIGLAEVMDYMGVINLSERMQQILGAALSANKVISGHCPGLRGRDLAAYLTAGANSDHEGMDPAELMEKLRLGMYVEGRVSSFNESMTSLGTIFKQPGSLPPNLVLCTDDIYPDDLLRSGHMDQVLRTGIKAGIPAVDLIRAATWNGAQRHRLYQAGAIIPGNWADIVLVNDLNNFRADEVFCRGKLQAAAGKMLILDDTRDVSINIPPERQVEAENTIHLKHLPKVEDFNIPARPGKSIEQLQVMNINPNLRRNLLVRSYPVVDGRLDITNDRDVCMVSILERHLSTGNHSRFLVSGLGCISGAAATTVSHDCHNLLVIGRDAADMALAVRTLAECGGGICSVFDGKVQALLPLPVAGLMGTGNVNETAELLHKLNFALKQQGVLQERPLTGLLSLALPVIPEYGLTDLGLVNVNTQALMPIYTDD
ncbi:MAG: adenine deaminase [Chloroflexota bacterium]